MNKPPLWFGFGVTLEPNKFAILGYGDHEYVTQRVEKKKQDYQHTTILNFFSGTFREDFSWWLTECGLVRVEIEDLLQLFKKNLIQRIEKGKL